MKVLLFILFSFLITNVIAQKKFELKELNEFGYSRLQTRIQLDANLEYIKSKSSEKVIFKFDTTMASFFQIFNDRYLLIKQIPHDNPVIYSASPIVIPVMNAAIIDLDNLDFVYYFKGNAKINSYGVRSFKQTKGKIILYTDDKKVKFTRLSNH